MKKLYSIGLSLLIICVFSAISLSLLLHTERGTLILLRLSKSVLPGDLTYKAVHGHVLGNLTIEDLHYQTESAQIQINKLFISTHLSHLTRLVSDKVLAQQIMINIRQAPTQKKQTKSTTTLPFTFQAKSIDLQQLKILYKQKELMQFSRLSGQALLAGQKSDVVIINESTEATKLLEYRQKQRQYLFNAAIPFKWMTVVTHCKGDDTKTQLEGFLTDRQQGLLTLRGAIVYSPQLTWQLYAKANNIHPHLFIPNGYKSEVNFTLHSAGNTKSNQLVVEDLFGKIKDQAFQGRANFEIENYGLKNVAVNLQSKNTFFQINGQTYPDWKFIWSANVPNLTIFMPHSEGNIQARGNITGNERAPIINGVIAVKNLRWQDLVMPSQLIQFTWDPMNPAKLLEVKSNIHTGLFSYKINQDPLKIKLQHGFVNALFNQHTLNTHLDVNTEHGKILGNLTVFRQLAKNSFTQQPIKGNFECQHIEPKLLEFFISYIKKMQGELQAHLTVAGTLSKPILKGDMVLDKASFTIPKQNLYIQNVHILAQGDDNKIDYQGVLTSGKGQLSLKGATYLNAKEVVTDLNLVGENVLIANTSEIKINSSPRINLQLTTHELRLKGKLFIPDASLQPRNFEGSDSISDDIVYVNNTGPQNLSTNLLIKSDIDLELGDRIVLNYQGIKGKILGNLKIVDSPERATIGYGQLRIQNGSYNVRNRTLQIDYGKLNFLGGPISDPSLDMRASRTVRTNSNSLLNSEQQIRVGVSVMGTLKKPKINLFSEPAGKSSEDILSYLILGVPVSSATNGMNAQLLLQAADAINLGGSSSLGSLKSNLQNRLGLAELDLGTQSQTDPKTQETIQHTSVVLGKFLSPKFYVNYSLDLFDHTNTLKVRYFLNKFWTLQSITNTNGSGVDILYTVEK